MIRGIELSIKRANSLLGAILQHPHFSNMVAVSSEYEVIADENNYTIPSPIIAGNLAKIIASKNPLIIFLNLKLLPQGNPVEIVSNYEEFACSAYSLICLITDVQYVEIYAKDITVLDEILRITQHLRISDIQLKDESDCRNSFSIV